MFELKHNKISYRNKLQLAQDIMVVLDGLDDWKLLEDMVREVYIAQVYLSNYDKFEQTKKDEDGVDYLDIMSTYDVLYELDFEEFMEENVQREYKLVNKLIDVMLEEKAKSEGIEGAMVGLINSWTEKTKDLDVEKVLKEFGDFDFSKFKEVEKILKLNHGTNERH